MEENGESEYKDTNAWHHVTKKRKEPKVNIVCGYWDGFDINGRERWYIRLSDNTVLTPSSPGYDVWKQRIKKPRKPFPYTIQ